jgi:predicted  nucleic acid-binding Zn-ribbon protein
VPGSRVTRLSEDGDDMEGNTVEGLLQLQEIDGLIGDRKARLAALQSESDQLVAELAGLEKETVTLNARLEKVEGEMRHAERTVQAGRATLKRLQVRAQEVHNMKEHTAARAEVDAARQNLEAAEDDLLDAMQDQETARSALTELEGDIASRQQEYGDRLADLDTERRQLEDEIAIELDRRSNRALRIDERARSLYDTVSRGRADSPLAPLVEGVCGHCYTAIPLQRQQVIRAGRVLVVCETCGVIMHVVD